MKGLILILIVASFSSSSAISGVYLDVKSRSIVGRLRGWVDRCVFDYHVWRENFSFSIFTWLARTYIRILHWMGRAPDLSQFEAVMKGAEKQ